MLPEPIIPTLKFFSIVCVPFLYAKSIHYIFIGQSQTDFVFDFIISFGTDAFDECYVFELLEFAVAVLMLILSSGGAVMSGAT